MVECIICNKEIKGKYKEIGLNLNGFYTENENLANQGFFPIGLKCYNIIKKKNN